MQILVSLRNADAPDAVPPLAKTEWYVPATNPHVLVAKSAFAA